MPVLNENAFEPFLTNPRFDILPRQHRKTVHGWRATPGINPELPLIEILDAIKGAEEPE